MAEYSQHVVKSGETLGKIAATNGTTIGELVALNGLSNPDLIRVGQILNIRRASDTTYVVRKGDSLSAIAAHYGVTVEALVAANGIENPNVISAGAELAIPTGTPSIYAVPVTTHAPAPSGSFPVPGSKSIASAKIARASVLSKSIGKCYRYVKRALLAGGAVDHYLGGVAAVEAGPLLIKQGFVDILGLAQAGIKSPYDAPVGAVIVYKATPGATDKNRIYGHIEIRTEDGFASDYFSPRARTGARDNGLVSNSSSGRAVLGVFVKPEVAAVASPLIVSQPSPVVADGNPFGAGNLLLPTVNGKYAGAILEAATRTGIAPQTIAAIINSEAAKIPATGQWNANSKASTSTATGLTQFINSTWRGEAVRSGGLLNDEAKRLGVVNASNAIVDDARLLAMRLDPRVSILAGADYAIANLVILRNAGALPVTLDPAGTAKLAYLAHHEGPNRATRFLRGQMGYVTDGILAANVPNAARRQELLDAAGGDRGVAYRTWFAGYVDRNVDIRQFMADKTGVTIPNLAAFFL